MQEIFLFYSQPFLACVAMAAILGYLGLHVLEREIIFIDIALAQVSAVGALIVHIFIHQKEDSLLSYLSSLLLTIVFALLYSLARKKVKEISIEAVIGISYSLAAAGALFLIGVSPGGHIHVQQMLSGSILWATWKDVFLCTSLFCIIGIFLFILRKPFKILSKNYNNQKNPVLNDFWWDFLFYIFMGAVITISVRIAGIVLVFAFLIIPATVSAIINSSWKIRLYISWTVCILAIISGIIFAEKLDFSLGPSIVMFLGLELIFFSFINLLYSLYLKHKRNKE